MKTIEERSHEVVTEIFSLPELRSRDRQALAPLITAHLRELIEDAAKICDAAAEGGQIGQFILPEIAAKIRALGEEKPHDD